MLLTYQPRIHRIEVTFITPPVINAKCLFQIKLSVTTWLRSDEFMQKYHTAVNLLQN
ncbi:hypothetical protein QE443_004727 [Pantoea ananatis]|nr:hypothetical protein [Pantoea ananatis]MDR6092191.1 hypothetical protein [Pantoea ananatis]SFY16891.1 hypothetical protein SAMN03097714_0048 [Pantoea ananatis]